MNRLNHLYCFDFFGGYLGYMDAQGNVFDSRGSKWARVGEGGRVYGLDGKPCGRIDRQGNFFADGAAGCRGYFRGWPGEPGATDASGLPGIPRPDVERLRMHA